jgi:hypothetical protein
MSQLPPNTVYFQTPTCQMCGQSTALMVDEEKLRRWQAGAYIQDVFPELGAEVREQMISGTHPDCWDELIDGEEDA